MAKKYLKNSKGTVSAITTDNLQLEKPLINENYDIEVFNRNMDKIDSAIKEANSRVSENKSNISSLQTKVDNGQMHKLTQDTGNVLPVPSKNFNDVIKTGFYYIGSGSIELNAPSGGNWYLDVKAMNSNYIYQQAIRNLSGNDLLKKYERTYYEGTWSQWREL